MEYTLKFQALVLSVSSSKFHALTKNGPFLDAHFGPLNQKTPIGETYYTDLY